MLYIFLKEKTNTHLERLDDMLRTHQGEFKMVERSWYSNPAIAFSSRIDSDYSVILATAMR